MALTQISTEGIKNGTITGSDLATNVDLVDNQKLRLGTGQDLLIFHDGTNSSVQNGTGTLRLRGDSIKLNNNAASENYLVATANGSVELYYDNSKKFETLSTGVLITGSDDGDGGAKGDFKFMQTNGTLKAMFDASASAFEFYDNTKAIFGNGDDLQIYHDGNSSFIFNTTGDLTLLDQSRIKHRTNQFVVNNYANDESIIYAAADGEVSLYHNGSKKFDTTSTGATITGALTTNTSGGNAVLGSHLDLGDNQKARFGASDDLEIYHDGSDSYIKDAGTGQLLILTNEFRLQNAAGNEQQIAANENGAVELYHDGTKRLETTANGVEIANALFVGEKIDMPDHTSGTNGMILLGTGDDLFMYHDGTNSHLRNNTGTFNIRSTNFRLTDAAIQHVYLKTNDSGNNDIQLYYDNNVKLATTSTGVSVTGAINASSNVTLSGGDFSTPGNLDLGDSSGAASGRVLLGAGDDLLLFHNGTDSFIQNTTGTLKISTQGGSDEVQINKGVVDEHMAKFIADGGVELYYNNSKKLETDNSGVSITGRIDTTGNVRINADNQKFIVGSGDDLEIYHSGSHSFIIDNGTGDLKLRGSEAVKIEDTSSGKPMITCTKNFGTEIYHQMNSAVATAEKKFETTTTGVKVFGQLVQERASARAVALNRLGSAGQMILFDFQGTKCGEILVDTNSTSYITNGSDKSLKKNFQSWSENVLNLFKNINPQEFHFNNQQDTDKKHKGYIAQDMVDSFPEAYPKDDEGKYAFNPSGMVVYLMKAIQELEAEVAALKAA